MTLKQLVVTLNAAYSEYGDVPVKILANMIGGCEGCEEAEHSLEVGIDDVEAWNTEIILYTDLFNPMDE